MLSNENRHNLQLLIDVAERMRFTLNDLIDLTQLNENEIRLNKTTVNVHGVAYGVIDMLSFMLEGKKIDMKVLIPPSFPQVNADENRLIQILFNLVHNAIKYSEKGTITIDAKHNKKTATIYVKDTGIGMDEATVQKIFQPYERQNSSMTSVSGGIGLGLSICQKLVTLHGGDIFVESKPGHGSTFPFSLPLVQEMADESYLSASISDIPNELEMATTMEVNLNKKEIDTTEASKYIKRVTRPNKRASILIVDDDSVNLNILQQILISDYKVVQATSGMEALEKLKHEEFDLIVSDVMMPYMSGYELTQKIREKFTISELPILLLTARGLPEDVHTAFHSGANGYLVKPIDALELKTRIAALIDLKLSVKELLRIEAAWLQAQIQPHFLFNTLNTIASLSEIDTARMVKLLDEFGTYLKHSFAVTNAESVVPINKEIELTRSYLYIEKERFGNRLKVNWDVDEDLSVHIPPLCIQSLVENTVMHGLLQKAIGGQVNISIKDKSTDIMIEISDDGVGMEQKRIDELLYSQIDTKAGIGVRNTDRRLKQLYGSGLDIKSELSKGTTVTFRIPKRSTE